MLFGVLFDSTGNLRPKIKAGCVDEVFDLQKVSALKPSFDFIADTLSAAGADFIELHGRGRALDVMVATKKVKKGYLVESIFVGGKDLLQPPVGESDDLDEIQPHLKAVMERLNGNMAVELVVPQRLLKVTYTPSIIDEDDLLLIPRGWSIKKD